MPESTQQHRKSASRLTRLEALRQAGSPVPAMPPVPDSAAYLIRHLFDAGPAMHGGMGPAPVTYTELAAWSRLTATELAPWEAQTLRRLSREYVAEQAAAADPLRPMPWVEVNGIQETRASVADAISDAFRTRIRAQHRGQPS